MSSKTETQVQVPGPTGQENRIRQALEQLGLASGGAIDIEALQRLAGGDVSASPEDQALIEQALGASRETAERATRAQFQEMTQAVEGGLLERGLEGSSIEAVSQAVLGRDLQRQLSDIVSQQQGQQAESMLALPYQRAGVQLSANQQLLQQLLGTTSPVLQSRLQERLVQQTQSSEHTPGLGELVGGVTQGIGSAIGQGL